jgi:cephalosporin hydroxylase
LDYFVKERTRYLAQRDMENSSGNRWFGVPVWQYPDDLLLYQEVVYETNPDIIIETGTHYGGLSLYLATLLTTVNPDGKVYTIDIDSSKLKQALESLAPEVRARLQDRLVILEGSSTDPKIVERIKKEIRPGSKVLVLLDADHRTDFVRQELALYAPLVTPGSYLIVNDTHLEKYYPRDAQGGAADAVREFVAGNKQFSVDAARNKFVVSCCPGSFLKRGEGGGS